MSKSYTYELRVDGHFLRLFRAPSTDAVFDAISLAVQEDFTGLEITKVKGAAYLLDLIEEGYDTTQKLRDYTQLTTREISAILHAPSQKGIVRNYHQTWAFS